MQLRFVFLTCLCCLALLTLQALCGEPPTAKTTGAPREDNPKRTDRYGDPLPPGVVARLGTERLTLARAIFLTFSPDGRCVAAHNGSGQLRIWEAASGKELLRVTTPIFYGYGSGMTPLRFSPNSKTIALACPAERGGGANQQASVRVWEVATGKELHCFGDLPDQASHVVFSPDGRYLFASGYGIPLLRWDLVEGGAPKEFGNSRSVAFLAVSRDATTLTAAINDRGDWRNHTFVRWDVATGKEIGRHAIPTGGRWAGSLSPEGNLFAVPEEDGKSIALLDPLTGRELTRARESDSHDLVSFCADGTRMACSSKDSTIRVWDTATGKMRARFKPLSTSVSWIALSPDGKRVALSGRADDAVHVWDVAASRELYSFAGHRGGPLTIAFLKEGKEIVTVSKDGCHVSPYVTEWADWSFRRWDAATGEELAVTRANPKGEVYHTAFSSDGRRLVAVIHDGTLRLWDVESGKVLRSWKVPTWESTSGWGDKVLKTPHPAITEPVFSPDGKILLAAHGPKILRWEVATGRELPAFEVKGLSPRGEPSACLPTPDGQILVLGSSESGDQFLLLDADSGKVRRRLEGIRGGSYEAISPDGRTLAVKEFEEVSLWELANGRPRGRLAVRGQTDGLAFSPDGRFLAIGSCSESPLSLWDLTTGRVVGRLQDDREEMMFPAAFSPDGSRLAVKNDSPTILVCDVAELCGKKKLEDITKGAPPSREELEGLWVELSSADSVRAYRAIRQLGRAGPRGAAFLKARLKGNKSLEERHIARLIADLDADTFAAREKASAELEKLGIRAQPALRRALQGEASAEVRSRVKRLLERLGSSQESLPDPELVRLRVVEALEANGSPEARQVLTELAEGSADTPLKQEAKASLARLRSRRVQQ